MIITLTGIPAEGGAHSQQISVDLHSSMAWFPPVSEQACTYCNCCCDLLEREPLCVIHKLSGWTEMTPKHLNYRKKTNIH